MENERKGERKVKRNWEELWSKGEREREVRRVIGRRIEKERKSILNK